MKKIIIGAIAIVVLGIAWYGLSPLLKNKVVNDPLPVPVITQPETSVTIADTPAAGNIEEKTQPVMTERVAITDTIAHPGSGFVRVVTDGTRQFLRYEDYKTINGPDVRVYLATDLKAKDFVDLGPIKGTEGNINYEIPPGTDLSKYRYALTWCEDFSVLFNSAELKL